MSVCSRLRGSASTPASASTLLAVLPARSDRNSLSSRAEAVGAANDDRIDTGTPARLPGV
jgi:hypothetical protein